MSLVVQMAQHLRTFYVGDNNTGVCLADKVDELNWKQATTKVVGFYDIATLVYHLGYYVTAARDVLSGQPLTAHDKFSFDSPEISCEQDWLCLKKRIFAEGKEVADLIERIPDERLWDYFYDQKYGTYYRCLQGTIEHCYYHLGQISIVRKLIDASDGNRDGVH